MRARYANDIEIAHAQRDFELKKASYDQEVETKKAQSELAYDLQVSSWLGGRCTRCVKAGIEQG
jgi:flotillin